MPVELGPPLQAADSFRISAGDQTLAGLAFVRVNDDAFDLQAVTPTGVALFAVHGGDDGVGVTAPDDGMAKALGLIPFERDLWLLYRWRCADRCRADGGTLTVDGEHVSWRGRGGPAEVVLGADRATLTDPRRGYELLVVRTRSTGP